MTHHLGLALRRLRGTPVFTVIAIASLAVGIGLNILIFAFTSPVLVEGLPYPEPDRLLDVSMAPPDSPELKGVVSPGLYVLLRDRAGAAFEAVGAVDAGRAANLAGDADGPAMRIDGHRISATGLAALGTAPLLGRLPLPADEQAGAQPTILLSYPLWQERFAGRTDIVGQTVSIDGQPTVILGVMPEGFGLLDNSSDAFFAFAFEPVPGQETQHNLRVIARLRPGVSMADAQAAANLALDEYAETYPDRDQGWTVELTPWQEARFGGMQQPLSMAQLAVGVILLLICVSIAVLLRARTVLGERAGVLSSSRLGPGVVFAESLILAVAGALVAVAATAMWLPALLEITPNVLPRLSEVRFDAGVLGFTLLLVVIVTVLVGALPALRSSRTDTATRGWLGALALVVLVAVQVALAFVLMAGTGLAMRAVNDLRGRDIGVDPTGLVSADVYLPRAPYVTRVETEPGTPEMVEFNPAGAALYGRIHAALQSMPGVVDAAGVATRPFASSPFVQFWIDDLEQIPPNRSAAQYLAVTENYFDTMGLRIVRGRDFSPADQADSPWVVLVNETLAQTQWPDEDAIGRQVTLTFSPNDEEPAREVIGVVADTLPFRGASEVPPLMYILHRQQGSPQRASLEGRRTVMSFVVRTAADPRDFEEALKAQVATVDATTPVTPVRPLESYLDAGQTALLHYGKMLLGTFALVALIAGFVGIYALTFYGLAHRQPLGALGLFVVAAVGAGVAAGLSGWLRLGSVIESFLTNLTVTPSDARPLVVTGAVLFVTALVAVVVATRARARAGR